MNQPEQKPETYALSMTADLLLEDGKEEYDTAVMYVTDNQNDIAILFGDGEDGGEQGEAWEEAFERMNQFFRINHGFTVIGVTEWLEVTIRNPNPARWGERFDFFKPSPTTPRFTEVGLQAFLEDKDGGKVRVVEKGVVGEGFVLDLDDHDADTKGEMGARFGELATALARSEEEYYGGLECAEKDYDNRVRDLLAYHRKCNREFTFYKVWA